MERLTEEQFAYWWQITRYNEICKEMKNIQDKTIDINKKIITLQKSIPKEDEGDDEAMKEKKIKKAMEINVKSNENQSSQKGQALCNFCL